jgi:proline iminopeptidase
MSLELYPEIKPFKTEQLIVSPIHTINIEQYGNPDGKPILFLHGGPGSGMNSHWARLFCPKGYRLISFDQRGCGKSLPTLCLEENTTWNLVADIEKIRLHLKINRWLITGGSWGCTLALAYAEKYPETVAGLILYSIFLGRKKEIEWTYQYGASEIFPEAWQNFLSHIPLVEQTDLVKAYYHRLSSRDKNIQLEAARAWSKWDANIIRLIPNQDLINEFNQAEFALPHALIECHYFANGCFFKQDDQLLAQAPAIRHIPTTIIHARYDMMCPIFIAYDLHKALPKAEFIVVPDAGHSACEASNARAIIAATNKHIS